MKAMQSRGTVRLLLEPFSVQNAGLATVCAGLAVVDVIVADLKLAIAVCRSLLALLLTLRLAVQSSGKCCVYGDSELSNGLGQLLDFLIER